MDRSDRIYSDFLVELDALERFRQRFQERHPAVPLDREDPDVRRLVEALAFFSMQTRHATMRNLRSTWQRLFAGFFDFLLTPVPAAAMAQAVVTEKMVEPVELPRGTELRLAPSGGGMTGVFRTQRDLRILPVFLAGTEVRAHARGHRLIMRFESRFARNDAVGTLSLYVRHLDSYRTSLAVFHAIRRSLQEVSVVFDEAADESSAGAPCDVAFGGFASGPESGDAAGAGSWNAPPPVDAAEYQHPFERLRAFFHFPERDLFVHVRVPPSRKAWTRFSLCFDLDKDWSTGRSLHPDFFQLFAVPVVNLRAEAAQPIVADGTSSEYPILNMNAGREYELHSVAGVYEMTKAGLSPVRPAWLPGAGASYQIEEPDPSAAGEPFETRRSLLLRMPEAFTAPRKIAVEALWHQPRFAPDAVGRIDVSTPGRHVEGLRWQLASDVRPHQDSALRDDLFTLVQLLAWRVKSVLGRDEVAALVSSLGLPPESPFRRVVPWVRDLTVAIAPDSALAGSGVRHIYKLTLAPFDPAFEPLVHTYLLAVREILDIWNAEATVDLRAAIAGGGELALLPGVA